MGGVFLKRNRCFFLFFAILGVLLLCFIFHNSLQSKTESHERSAQISDIFSRKKKSHVKKKNSFWKQITKKLPFFSLEKVIRKLAHILEYAALGWDIYALSVYIRRYASRRHFAVFLWFCALVPCVDECIQYFVPGRTASFFDIGIDWIGMLFGALIALLMYICVQCFTVHWHITAASKAG